MKGNSRRIRRHNEFGRGFVQSDDSIMELKQRHAASMWSYLTDGRADHYDQERNVRSEATDREDA